jgi:hypothetical protein
VRYANDLVLLAREETVLEGTIDRLNEIGRCNGMETKAKKTKVMRTSRQPSSIQIMIDQKTAVECGILGI